MTGVNAIDLDGFTADAFSWGNLVQAVQYSSGSRWFSSYPEVSLRELRDVFPPVEQLRDVITFADQWRVRVPFGAMQADGNVWDLPAETTRNLRWRDDSRGLRILTILDDLGVEYSLGDDGTGLLMYFATNGSPVKQVALICQRDDGSCVLDWSTCLLTTDARQDELTTILLQSRFFHVPAVVQAAFFIGENPFPTTGNMFQLDRTIAYAGVPEHLLPVPGLSVQTGSDVEVNFMNGSELGHHVLSEVPTVVFAGYAVPVPDDDDQLSTTLATVITTLVKAHMPLYDGWVNNVETSPTSFNVLLLAGSGLGTSEDEFLPGAGLAAAFDIAPVPSAEGFLRQSPGGFCTECGSPHGEVAKFCGACGSRLS